MRPRYWVTLFLLICLTGGLEGQAEPASGVVPAAVFWGARPLPPELAPEPRALILVASPDSTRRRPFYLPGPGEHTAFWAGFGAGLAVSPLLWCDGPGCGAVIKASTSLGLAVAGGVGGLLLSRTF